VARTTGTVSLADLLKRGVLLPGENLLLRHRSAPHTEGVLQEDGSIKIGSQKYATPSAAARHSRRHGAVDGWLRWRVPRLGNQTLAELREENA